MSKYPNSWSGKSQFYKGKRKKLPTVESDHEYKKYCEGKKNKNKILSYSDWCKRERRKRGMV